MSVPGTHHLTGTRAIWRGGTWRRQFTVKEDGLAISLAGWSPSMLITDSEGATVLSLTVGSGISIVSTPEGKFQAEVTAVQSADLAAGTYDYLIKMTNGAVVQPLVAGLIEVTGEIPP